MSEQLERWVAMLEVRMRALVRADGALTDHYVRLARELDGLKDKLARQQRAAPQDLGDMGRRLVAVEETCARLRHRVIELEEVNDGLLTLLKEWRNGSARSG